MFQEDHLPPGGAGFIELENVSADDVLDVVSGRQKFDVNGHGKIHYTRQLRYETDFLNDMPESALIEIFQFIAADRGVTMPSAYDHLRYIIQGITEQVIKMKENKNWEGFTDVSHPNWTLRTPRVSRGGYFVEPEKKCDSIVWWLLIAGVILGFVLVL